MKKMIVLLMLMSLLPGCSFLMSPEEFKAGLHNINWDLVMDIATEFVADGKIKVDMGKVSELVGHDVEPSVAKWHAAALYAAKAAQVILTGVLSRDPVVSEIVEEYERRL